jgi:hypothetical protein
MPLWRPAQPELDDEIHRFKPQIFSAMCRCSYLPLLSVRLASELLNLATAKY